MLSRVECRAPIIAALDVDVGRDGAEKLGGAGLGKDDDGVHAGKRRQDGGPLPGGDQGATGTLEAPDGSVGVEADNEAVAEVPGLLKVADVAVVEEVETAIGGDQTEAVAAGNRGPTARGVEAEELAGRSLSLIPFHALGLCAPQNDPGRLIGSRLNSTTLE